jgi:hypothetical protein
MVLGAMLWACGGGGPTEETGEGGASASASSSGTGGTVVDKTGMTLEICRNVCAAKSAQCPPPEGSPISDCTGWCQKMYTLVDCTEALDGVFACLAPHPCEGCGAEAAAVQQCLYTFCGAHPETPICQE